MTHGTTATANDTRATVYSILNGMVTFDDGFRIEFTPALPSWIANRQAHEIRDGLDAGRTVYGTNALGQLLFDAFQIADPVDSIV
jgi:hypothetical protein